LSEKGVWGIKLMVDKLNCKFVFNLETV